MVKKNKRKIYLLTIIFSLLICIALYWWLTPLAIIVKTESGTCLTLPTRLGDTFSLRFTHSVHKTPVWENFVVTGVDGLMLTSTEYRSYGVGMPSLPSEGVFTQLNDRFILTNLNRPFSQIPVRVGPEAQLSLVHHGQEYPVYEWFEPGTLVVVSTNYDYLWFISAI
ncbi:MAG: hypothetical protein H6Q68_2502 [Firmicutes bacterium]|nr:hypothetical protein [Bacillota bacterium]